MTKYIALSTDYLLRKELSGKYILYNKKKFLQYTITPKLFKFLSLYKEGNLKLEDILKYLTTKNIKTDDLESFFHNEEFADIFVPVTNMCHNSIYDDILTPPSPFTEYTPERIDFLITKHCNLQCPHCFERSSPKIKTEEININALDSLFHQMDQLNIKTLKITGGEPLSVPNINEILTMISRRRFECIILTNGALLNDRIIEILSQGSIKLGISLDGITKQTHEQIRGKGSFNKLLNNLRKLKEAGIFFSITTSLNKYNYDEIEEIAKYVLEDLKADSFFVNQLKPLGRAKDNKDLFLTVSEYKNLLFRLKKLEGKYGKRKFMISDDAMLSDNYSIKIKETSETPIVCAAGNSILAIDNALRVYPCIYVVGNKEFCIGDLCKDSLLEIWKSPLWHRFRGGTLLKDIVECDSCKLRDKCFMKNCRLKPVYDGQGFYSHVNYCKCLS